MVFLIYLVLLRKLANKTQNIQINTIPAISETHGMEDHSFLYYKKDSRSILQISFKSIF